MTQIDNVPTNARRDIPDFRDEPYKPSLTRLAPRMAPPSDLKILDQGTEGACTGFGLAAVINLLNARRGSDFEVSPRMLYEMARKFDRWPGQDYSGSSCRGAIKGWYSMGVCSDKSAPYQANDNEPFHLDVQMAKEARANTIGAYYRVGPNIVDMHAAMNEAGALYVSAAVHDGWRRSAVIDGSINPSSNMSGGHAFCIVGYDETGFFIQNSWGLDWGDRGVAHWKYEDWQDNVRDAWVIRLALPTPQLRGRARERNREGTMGFGAKGPRREEIAGHFVHVDDGQFHDEDQYWSNLADVTETARFLGDSGDYDHLLFYAHGGLNSTTASATRIAAMKDVFKANRIYPFHFMYDTGAAEEIKDVILGKRKQTDEMVGGFTDFSDRLVERLSHRAGRALWREMKSDAAASFRDRNRPGSQTLTAFLAALEKGRGCEKSIHLVGHSTGAILLAHLLAALGDQGVTRRIASVSLLAPAATVDLFESHYRPILATQDTAFGIDQLSIYNLNEKLEEDDNVAGVYRKSLLYLVSNAFEETEKERILGMMKFSKNINRSKGFELVYSNARTGPSTRTASTSHGGFDNDRYTMNDILKTVLNGEPRRPFTDRDLGY